MSDSAPPGDVTLHELRARLDELALEVRASSPVFSRAKETLPLVTSALHQVYRALAAPDAGALSDALLLAQLELERAAELVPTDGETAALHAALAGASVLSARARPSHAVLSLPSVYRSWRGAGASVGVPVLLDPPREVHSPALPVDPREPDPAVRSVAAHALPMASLEELDALVGEAAKLDGKPTAAPRVSRPQPSPAQPSFAYEHASSLIEELGVLGQQRRQGPGQTWTGKSRVEARLLARIDAIVSLGAQVLPALVLKLERRPLPDPELTWALVLLFGCLDGDDMADQAIRIVRASDLAWDEMREVVGEALALAPSPAIEPRVRAWLESSDTALRELAARVLGTRGCLSTAEIARAAHDAELPVVRAAAQALYRAGYVEGRVLESLLQHDDEAIVREAMRASVLLGEGAGLRRARALVAQHRGAFASAAIVYAIGEGRAGLDALLEDAAVSGEPVVLEALGWFGHVGAVPYLLGRLAAPDEATRVASARSLTRLLGPAAGAGAHAQDPSLDLADWTARWQAGGWDPATRYRFGRAWRGESDVLEILHDRSSMTDRRWGHAELGARLGVTSHFDPADFVVRQRHQIDALRQHLAQVEGASSGWPVHLRF